MPSVESALLDITRLKYMIQTDLKQAFFQIPLSKASLKFCGVCTLFKGVRIYTRSAMGMPDSETVLEELLNRVLGEFIQDGFVTKIADDLHVGGDSPSDLLSNWSRVLGALKRNNLVLNATKTCIAPKSATVFGWIWSNGTIRPSLHHIAALAKVDPPNTVRGLRSFIGAYKVLSRVLKGYSDLLAPLDHAVAGQQSSSKITWTDSLLTAFHAAQRALHGAKTITVPKQEDQLWPMHPPSSVALVPLSMSTGRTPSYAEVFSMPVWNAIKFLGYLVKLKHWGWHQPWTILHHTLSKVFTSLFGGVGSYPTAATTRMKTINAVE